jgi:hypothetical protein
MSGGKVTKKAYFSYTIFSIKAYHALTFAHDTSCLVPHLIFRQQYRPASYAIASPEGRIEMV